MEKRLKKILSAFTGKKDEIIPILQAVQQEFGYLSKDNMLAIAEFARVPESQVYGIATFYAQFRFSPIGKKHIMLCRGTACHVRGAPLILEEVENRIGIKEGETTGDLEYSLETVACIGACGLAPTMRINNETFGHMTKKKVSEIFSKHKPGKKKK